MTEFEELLRELEAFDRARQRSATLAKSQPAALFTHRPRAPVDPQATRRQMAKVTANLQRLARQAGATSGQVRKEQPLAKALELRGAYLGAKAALDKQIETMRETGVSALQITLADMQLREIGARLHGLGIV